MMTNFVMIAMGLSLVSGIPKPDLVSVDIGSIQAGGGVGFSPGGYETWYILPDISVSIGQARVCWGKKVAFATGLEIYRDELAVLPASNSLMKYSYLLMPQIGLSLMLGPARTRLIKPNACIGPPVYNENYIPRLEIACGYSPLINISNETFSLPVLRTEVKFAITRSIQLILENRNVWTYDDRGEYLETFNTSSLSFCFAIGCDYFIHDKQPNEGESN